MQCLFVLFLSCASLIKFKVINGSIGSFLKKILLPLAIPCDYCEIRVTWNGVSRGDFVQKYKPRICVSTNP